MRLSPRFAIDNVFLVGAAFLVVCAMAFSAPVAGWIAFGVSTGLAVMAATSAAMSRQASRRAGHSAIGVVALWSLIAALVFAGPVLTWLVFADAIGLGVLAIADLTLHEAGTERVVHHLEVAEAASRTHTGEGRIAA